ncbi:hypothetical protein F9278_23125 [Streptomyces phaeolivaceus]|uniref:Uncharacterized protein n=1 Tax=Streptomyces phaeolivaceus TaxID=2653200 RepID=A0A5P8K5H7_9ACTN|nr:hypothetical protein [Streptomyces phaeolivaceus]QFQ98573.1 hypothetical protein F9278_23125 [Streptomyces phaeolivaceus]
METTQHVIHRNGLFSRFLLILVGFAVLLLGYTLIRENLPQRLTHDWPWKLRLLDIQSATAAVLATGGASLARAQYARTVRPAIGYFGRVMDGMAPDGRLAWVCHLFNGGQDVAVTTHLSYWVTFTSAAKAQGGVADSSDWMTHQAAVDLMESRALRYRRDFAIDLIGAGRPVPGEQLMFLGWFTEEAMSELENVFVKVRVIDRVGDTHERIISLLKGANRSPRHPDPPPF